MLRFAVNICKRPILRLPLLSRQFSINTVSNHKLTEFITLSVDSLITNQTKNPRQYPITLSQLITFMNSEGIKEIPKNLHSSLQQLCERTVNTIPELNVADVIKVTQNLHLLSRQIGFSLGMSQFETYFKLLNTSSSCSSFNIL